MVKIDPVFQRIIVDEPSVICNKDGGNLPGKTQCRRVGGDEGVGHGLQQGFISQLPKPEELGLEKVQV
jgi:hypothetical protein